jgi:hypothetical protein
MFERRWSTADSTCVIALTCRRRDAPRIKYQRSHITAHLTQRHPHHTPRSFVPTSHNNSPLNHLHVAADHLPATPRI